MAERTVRIRLEAATQQFKQQFKQASATVKAEGRTMMGIAEQNSAAFTAAGVAVGAAGAAIAMGLKSAGREAAAFESRLTKSTTLIGISTDEMRKMGDAALRMSDTGKGPQELADALFFAQSAGLRGADALDVVEQSAKAASIGLGDTATITDLVTSAVNAYGTENLSAAQATDTLVGTVREGKAEASELAGSMGRVLPIASNMGVSLDQVGAAMAAMTRTGTNASESATQLRAIMLGLLKPTKEAEEALGGVGLSASGLRDTIKEDGLWAALQELKTAVGDNDDAMAQIFPNVRALSGVLDLTGESAEATGEIFDSMTDVAGLTAEGFAEWSKTTEASQQRFSASMEAVKISAGESLQGPLKQVLDLGTGINEMFIDLPPLAQNIAVGLVAAASATALLGGAALVALPRMLAFKTALESMGATRTLGALSATKSFLMGPWGVAMGAAVVGIGLFAKAKANQARKIEEVIATLNEETGTLTKNTDAWLINELQQSGALDQADALGISKSDLIGAIKGEADALDRVNAAMAENSGESKESMEAAGALHLNVGLLGKTIEESTKKWRETNEALAESEGKYLDVEHAISKGLAPAEASLRMHLQASTDAAAEGGAAAGDLGDDYDDLTGDVEETVSALENYIDRVKRATDPVYALSSALEDVEDAQQAYTDAVEEHGPQSEEARLAALDLTKAVAGAEQAAIDGDLSFSEFDRKLRQWVDAGVITAEQADATRERVAELRSESERYAGTYQAYVALNGYGETLAQLQELARAADRVGDDIHVNVSGTTIGGRTMHAGGWVTAGDRPPANVARAMGLGSDEVPATLQTGELVLSRSQAAALGGGGSTTHDNRKSTTIDQHFYGPVDSNGAGRAGALALRLA